MSCSARRRQRRCLRLQQRRVWQRHSALLHLSALLHEAFLSRLLHNIIRTCPLISFRFSLLSLRFFYFPWWVDAMGFQGFQLTSFLIYIFLSSKAVEIDRKLIFRKVFPSITSRQITWRVRPTFYHEVWSAHLENLILASCTCDLCIIKWELSSLELSTVEW